MNVYCLFECEKRMLVPSASVQFSLFVAFCLQSLEQFRAVTLLCRHRNVTLAPFVCVGAFGTLGVGGGFALGAKLCRPESEVMHCFIIFEMLCLIVH